MLPVCSTISAGSGLAEGEQAAKPGAGRRSTRPITVVAVLMLLEEGHFLLGDAIARFLPEFAEIKVAGGGQPATR